MARVQAVVFDLDGTLLDHEASVAAALAGWLPEFGVESSDAHVAAWLAAEQAHVRSWHEGALTWQGQRRRRLQDFLPLIAVEPGGEAELDRTFSAYLRHYEAGWRAFDDARPAVAALAARGLPLAMLTNGAAEQQRAKLAVLGLQGAFDPLLTAEELGVAKPQAAAYAITCDRLGLPPEEVLHVGDVWELDVVAPRTSGMLAVQVDRSAVVSSRDRIRTLNELPSHIDGLERLGAG